jgi:hypothetical protein
VAGAAGLSGLARETRQRLRRRRKADGQQAAENGGKHGRNEQPAVSDSSGKTNAIASHRVLSRRQRHCVLTHPSTKPLTAMTLGQESTARPNQWQRRIRFHDEETFRQQ